LDIGGGFLKFGNPGIFSTASGYAGGPSNFFPPLIERKESRFFHQRKFVSYERIPTVAGKERVQAFNPEDTALSASTADYEFHPVDRDI